MKLRADTILASFVVALFSSFLVALAVLLVRTMALSVLKSHVIADLILNIFVLFFFSGFVFFKGSTIAAWLLYKHDVTWGYKLSYARVWPIFIASFVMATAVFFAIYFYVTAEIPLFAYLTEPARFLHANKF